MKRFEVRKLAEQPTPTGIGTGVMHQVWDTKLDKEVSRLWNGEDARSFARSKNKQHEAEDPRGAAREKRDALAKKLVGATITSIEFENEEGTGYVTIRVAAPGGLDLYLNILRDEEGNGPGVVEVVEWDYDPPGHAANLGMLWAERGR